MRRWAEKRLHTHSVCVCVCVQCLLFACNPLNNDDDDATHHSLMGAMHCTRSMHARTKAATSERSSSMVSDYTWRDVSDGRTDSPARPSYSSRRRRCRRLAQRAVSLTLRRTDRDKSHTAEDAGPPSPRTHRGRRKCSWKNVDCGGGGGRATGGGSRACMRVNGFSNERVATDRDESPTAFSTTLTTTRRGRQPGRTTGGVTGVNTIMSDNREQCKQLFDTSSQRGILPRWRGEAAAAAATPFSCLMISYSRVRAREDQKQLRHLKGYSENCEIKLGAII